MRDFRRMIFRLAIKGWGPRGLGDVSGILMGSVSHKVAHLATSACVTVK